MKLRFPTCCWMPLALAGMLAAQEPADPPARVARLNYLDGPVSFRPLSQRAWTPATLNYPITTGDRLWVGQDAYAELHIGSTAIHLAPQTAFAILLLDDRAAQMSVSEGTLYLSVPRLEDREIVEVDTPNGAISVLQAGDYRIDVDVAHNATSVTVRSGLAEVGGNGRVFQIHPGRMLQLVDDDDVADIQPAAEPDPWEDWCVGRDQLAEHECDISGQYVSPEMTGSEDLAEYGDWSTDAVYGAVWVPRRMPSGWAPYRHGHWAYILPWGWTWIDGAPWGFAPFHYGRWERTAFGWVWVPGKFTAHPVYAPALVVFVTSAGLSASGAARAGRVTAWIPLASGEIFHPNYRVSEAYLRKVNGGNQGMVAYIGRAGMTAVPQAAFAASRQVAAAALPIPAGAAANLRTVREDAAPSRDSGAGAAAPPSGIATRAVFVTHELPPEVRPAVPIRGREAASVDTSVTQTQAAALPASGPPPDPSAPLEQPLAAPVYLSPARVSTPSAQPAGRQEQARPTPPAAAPPPQQHPPAPVSSPRPVERRGETRPAPPARTSDSGSKRK